MDRRIGRRQKQPSAAEELLRPLPYGGGRTISVRGDRKQSSSQRFNTGFGIEVRVGTDPRWIPGEAEELVRKIFERERRNTAVEEFDFPM